MTQKSSRGKRRGPVNDSARPGGSTSAASPDRYQKFLPEWMKGATAATPVRPPRPKRARQARPAGGYTPGKAAMGEYR
jgi:hypothetical protein